MTEGLFLPERFRLSRKPGATSPGGGMSVARPTRWGNRFAVCRWREVGPWIVAEVDPKGQRGFAAPDVTEGWVCDSKDEAIQVAVDLHRRWVLFKLITNPKALEPLRGRPLGCWCDLAAPCHATTLIELANRELDLDAAYALWDKARNHGRTP